MNITSVIFKDLLSGVLATDQNYMKFYTVTSSDPTIRLENCVIDDIDLSEEIVCQYNLDLRGCTFRSNFRIMRGTFKKVHIQQSFFSDGYSFTIVEGVFTIFSFDGAKGSKGSFSIHGGTFQNIVIKGDFNEPIYFRGGTFRVIHIDTCNVRSLFFRDGNYDLIQISGLTCSELHFSDGTFSKLVFYGLTKIASIYLISGIIDLLQLQAPNIEAIKTLSDKKGTLSIKKLELNQMGSFDGSFSNLTIDEIVFGPSYLHNNSRLRFQNIDTLSISFSGFINYGQLAFFSLTLENKLTVSNTDLGKASFINSDIKNIDLIIEDSRITECFFSYASFPNKVATNDHQQTKVYAQFKKINEIKGDYLEANRFYALEMNAYYNTIPWGNKHFWEKLNLFLNKYSNNHGQNWALGLLNTLIVGAVFYSLYLLSFGGWQFRICSLAYWKSFFGYASYFVEFINPIHKTDAIADSIKLKSNNVARFVETISRIFIAYTIYQMVQAFRKHAKK